MGPALQSNMASENWAEPMTAESQIQGGQEKAEISHALSEKFSGSTKVFTFLADTWLLGSTFSLPVTCLTLQMFSQKLCFCKGTLLWARQYQPCMSPLTFSEENMTELIFCDPACHDSPTSNPALNAEPGPSTRFLSKAHRRTINAKGGQTEQHPRRVGEGREKGSCNLPALACQRGQDDSAPHKDSYLDMHKCHLFFHMKDKIPPLPTSYQVSVKVWEGNPISAVHPVSSTKEDAGMEGGYTGCVVGSWEH